MKGKISRCGGRYYVLALLTVAASCPSPFPHLFYFSAPAAISLLPQPDRNHNENDLMLVYTCDVVNLSDFDNSEIRRVVLPRIERDYKRAVVSSTDTAASRFALFQFLLFRVGNSNSEENKSGTARKRDDGE
jgi:hypothetical protein